MDTEMSPEPLGFIKPGNTESRSHDHTSNVDDGKTPAEVKTVAELGGVAGLGINEK